MAAHQPILVIEADERFGQAIIDQLTADDYPAQLANSASAATAIARTDPPALVILGELDAPHDALRLLRAIRAGRAGSPWHPDVPVIMLSLDCEQTDLLRAFDAGTDDFLEHPPTYLELRARLQALLRRSAGPFLNTILRVGPLTIDTNAHTASLHGKRVDLRPMEYELLVHLARCPARVSRTPEILQTVWHYPQSCRTRTVASHASRLRRKLNDIGGQWIINVPGVGYRLI